MSRDSEILSKIRQVVYSSYPDAEIILYGSRARGDSKKLSDWDLLILLNFPEITFNIETKLIDDLYDIEIDTGEVISTLLYTKKDWNEYHTFTPLYGNIQKDGIRL